MAAGRIVVPPYFPARNRDFDLLAGAKLYVYTNLTTEKASIYADEAMTILSPNPVIANSSGQFPAIYAEAGSIGAPVLYSISVTTSTGASPGNPFNFDNYTPSVDWETAAVALAEAAADSAAASAGEAADDRTAVESIYDDILAIEATGSNAPAIAARALRDGSNLTGGEPDSFLTNLGATALGKAVFTAADAESIAGDLLVRPEPFSQASGVGVLGVVTTGVRNTGFGYEALKANTGGSENTAFGYLALNDVTGGTDPEANYNSAFGSFSLASVTTGYKNAAFGRATGDNLTTGYHDTALGYGAMHWHTTALNCVGVGFEAVHGGVGLVGTAMQGTVGVGFQALYACTGNFNTAVGTSAGVAITTGLRNVAVGANALNTQTTANDTTAIGFGAGTTNTGSGNIFVGQGADANAGRSNVTVIGTGLSATADNTILMGNGQDLLPGSTARDIGSQAKPWNYIIGANSFYAHCNTAVPAGGTTGAGFLLSSTGNFGVFFGSGAPTLSAARGSLYLRTDGSGTSDRMYVNTDSGTTWTAVTTAS